MLVVHAAATWFMCGLIWFVQVVHYPLFAAVGADGFPAYHARHGSLTSLVVGAPMLVELLTAFMLLAWPPRTAQPWELWTGAGLVLVIWLSTALLQVPQHNRLGLGYDGGLVRALVMGNVIRTVAWTARAGLVAVWLIRAVRG